MSGATRVLWSRRLWEENEYSFPQNFQDTMIFPHIGTSELLVVLEVSAYTFVVGWFVHRPQSHGGYRLLYFLARSSASGSGI